MAKELSEYMAHIVPFLCQIQREQEHYRLQIIDPKVESHAHVPAHSHTLPSFVRKRNKTPDFPSAHSKRSFTKLDPLEQRRTRVKVRKVSYRRIGTPGGSACLHIVFEYKSHLAPCLYSCPIEAPYHTGTGRQELKSAFG